MIKKKKKIQSILITSHKNNQIKSNVQNNSQQKNIVYPIILKKNIIGLIYERYILKGKCQAITDAKYAKYFLKWEANLQY